MVIDGHSHVVLPVEEHIKLMDTTGIDKTVLFSTSMHPETANTFTDIQKEMYKLNEIIQENSETSIQAKTKAIKEQKEAIDLYPAKYIGFGSVPSILNEREINEYIEQEIVGRGFVGLGEFTLPSGSIKLLSPIFKASTNFGNLPLWVHAFHPLTGQDIKELAQYAKDFPSVPVIIGHLGGSFWLETIGLVQTISNLYLDTSSFFSALVLKTALNELPSKCIFGVDMPYGDLQLSLDAVRKLSSDGHVANAVLGENIAALLKI